MITRSQQTGKYRLGLTALRIGIASGNQIELRRELRPFLQELMQKTGETSNLAILSDLDPVFIDNVESPRSLRMLSRIGRRTYPYSTSVGKVLLAYQCPKRLEYILSQRPLEQRTHKSITTRETLEAELKRVRDQGYAVDNEEAELGARCVGAPIFDHPGTVVAAVSVSGPSARVSEANLVRLGDIVRSVAQHASVALGYHNQADKMAR